VEFRNNRVVVSIRESYGQFCMFDVVKVDRIEYRPPMICSNLLIFLYQIPGCGVNIIREVYYIDPYTLTSLFPTCDRL